MNLEDRCETTDYILVGYPSALDSMQIVVLLLDIEQMFLDRYGLSLTLVNEKAISQKNSPFRTVNTLANYILGLL